MWHQADGCTGLDQRHIVDAVTFTAVTDEEVQGGNGTCKGQTAFLCHEQGDWQQHAQWPKVVWNQTSTHHEKEKQSNRKVKDSSNPFFDLIMLIAAMETGIHYEGSAPCVAMVVIKTASSVLQTLTALSTSF